MNYHNCCNHTLVIGCVSGTVRIEHNNKIVYRSYDLESTSLCRIYCYFSEVCIHLFNLLPTIRFNDKQYNKILRKYIIKKEKI